MTIKCCTVEIPSVTQICKQATGNLIFTLRAFTVQGGLLYGGKQKPKNPARRLNKVKAKIAEQQARLKELEQKKLEAENSEIVDIVRGMSISLAELPLVLQQLREGTSGQSVQKSEPAEKEENEI